MNTSTDYPPWAFLVILTPLVYLAYKSWKRKDAYNSIKTNFSIQVDSTITDKVKNEIDDINKKDKTILTANEIIFINKENFVFPLIYGSSTITGGHWTGLRAYTYTGVYTLALCDEAKKYFIKNNKVFKQSNEQGLSHVYFICNMGDLIKSN